MGWVIDSTDGEFKMGDCEFRMRPRQFVLRVVPPDTSPTKPTATPFTDRPGHGPARAYVPAKIDEAC